MAASKTGLLVRDGGLFASYDRDQMRGSPIAGTAKTTSLRAHRFAAPGIVLVLALTSTSAVAQTATDPLPPTIGEVVKAMPADLYRFINWDTAIVLGAGGGAALVGHVWDDDLADEVERARNRR